MDHGSIAGLPEGPVRVPESLARLARGSLAPVWENQLGGLAFREEPPADHRGSAIPMPDSPSTDMSAGDSMRSAARYLKWIAAGAPEIDFAGEAARLRWARAAGALVPEVLEQGSDSSGQWLVTAALPGDSAVAPRWIAAPETAARAIGAGLRALHDGLDPAACPFDWSIEHRLGQAAERRRQGLNPEADEVDYMRLADPPPIDRLVVCHGDACAPNTILDERGGFAGHVDLGALGVADRWADLAVAAWSTEWNYGPGYEHLVYDGYGIEPDSERIAYYRLLWDLS